MSVLEASQAEGRVLGRGRGGSTVSVCGGKGLSRRGGGRTADARGDGDGWRGARGGHVLRAAVESDPRAQTPAPLSGPGASFPYSALRCASCLPCCPPRG